MLSNIRSQRPSSSSRGSSALTLPLPSGPAARALLLPARRRRLDARRHGPRPDGDAVGRDPRAARRPGRADLHHAHASRPRRRRRGGRARRRVRRSSRAGSTTRSASGSGASDDWPERIAEWFLRNGVPPEVAEELIESGHVFADFVRFAWNPTLVEPGDEIDGWRDPRDAGPRRRAPRASHRGGVLDRGRHAAHADHAGDRALPGEPARSARRLPRHARARRRSSRRASPTAATARRSPTRRARCARDRRPPRRPARPDRGGARRGAADRLRGLARPLRARRCRRSSAVSRSPRRCRTSSGSSCSAGPSGARTTGPSPILRASSGGRPPV